MKSGPGIRSVGSELRKTLDHLWSNVRIKLDHNGPEIRVDYSNILVGLRLHAFFDVCVSSCRVVRLVLPGICVLVALTTHCQCGNERAKKNDDPDPAAIFLQLAAGVICMQF